MNYVSEHREYFRKANLQKRGNLKDMINYKKGHKERNNMNLTNREYSKNRRSCSLLKQIFSEGFILWLSRLK